jgi:CxxC motif-containing protein
MCPKGCLGTVKKDGDTILEVSGFTCKRGEEYGREEVVSPKRMLTTTVKTANGTLSLLPVVSKDLLPKNRIMDCVHALRKVVVPVPICEGDIVASDILGLGIDIIASRDMTAHM